MAIRYYSNGPATTLVANVGASDTTITVADASGFPALTPFTLILDKDEATEEVVEVTAKVGNQLTVNRGVDNTTAFAHNAGAVVAHGVSARDYREANQHINATNTVHGVTGDLVGTTDAQTLTNKTLTGATINGGTITAAAIREATVIQPTTPSGQVILRDSNGVDRGFIDGNSVIQGQRLRAINDDPANIVLTVQGAPGQTQPMVNVRDSGGTDALRIGGDRRFAINNASTGSATTLWVKPVAASDVVVLIQGAASQTGHLLRITASDNTLLAWIDANGYLTAKNFDATDWQTYTPNWGNAGSATFNFRAGRWKRVGTKTVIFSLEVEIATAGSGTLPVFTSLPTPPNRTVRWTFGGRSDNAGGVLQAVCFTSGSGNIVDRIILVSGSTTKNLTGEDCTAGRIFTISGAYEEA